MEGFTMTAKHSAPVRGLMSAGRSPTFEGLFGRMFRSLPPASFGKTEDDNTTNLTALGVAMSGSADDVAKDGRDDEESGIPALYTYFGQFVDHDITFDPASSLQKQNDPDALVDFRTPAFDLDNVYGRGPGDQPYIYDNSDAFLLGNALQGGSDAGAKDLPRNAATQGRRRALIGDPRNDENAIVSQLQGLFLRFHNRKLQDNPGISSFETLQRLVRFHYQYVVLNDFLPRIVHSSVLNQLKTNGKYDAHKLQYFHWKNAPFMPVEFSVAAYRFGHSMVRPGYRLNDQVMLPIFPTAASPEGLTGFREMNTAWGLDWGRFIDIDIRKYDGTDAENAKRLQYAYRIDTSLVNPLGNLPPAIASNPASLGARNLLRGWRLGLPSGQHVAQQMGVKPMDDKDILLGQGVDQPDEPLPNILSVSQVFKGNCPLWTYILAEAMRFREQVKIPVTEDKSIQTPRLGPVGGRIVAEVFLGLMYGDKHSMLSVAPDWQPNEGPDFKLKDFVRYAIGQ
jgi:hypothetical protein